MRETLYNWTVGFFTISAPKKEDKTLTISPAFYLKEKINGLSHYDYLAGKKFLADGYTKIQFNNFDFQNPELQPLLEILHPSFFFVQAEFTVQQVCAFISNGFDLSKCYYKTVGSNSPMILDDYAKLYYFCLTHSFQKSLHGVAVYFNEESNISHFPDDFASVCNVTSFYDITVSQAQFDFLLVKKIGESLDLTGILLANMNVTYLIDDNYERIVFYKKDFSLNSKKVCLAETSIRDAIIETETVASCAKSSKFYDWFLEDCLTFTIRHYDRTAFTFIDYEINVNSIIRQLECATPIKDSQRNKTPRFYTPNAFYTALAEIVREHDPLNVDLVLNQKDKGITLLWAIYCAVHIPDSSIAESFWSALGVKKPEWSSKEPAQSYLAPASLPLT